MASVIETGLEISTMALKVNAIQCLLACVACLIVPRDKERAIAGWHTAIAWCLFALACWVLLAMLFISTGLIIGGKSG